MLKIILSVLLLLSFTILDAQENKPGPGLKITGKISDSASKKPIEYATLSLINNSTNKVINGTISANDGHFEMTGIDEGIYHLIIECIGYSNQELTNITVNKKSPLLDLKEIRLTPNHQTLQAVTVTGRTSLIDNKIDKMVFNAEKDITSQSGVATDILRKVPQVSVDVDGNVELAGSSSIRFLIDGKPSAAFGNNIADVLQSIPASQIKSIEVITNPGAKYDAQGLGGIINIILKQNKARGINGNISVTAGTRNDNGSLNLNVRNGDFGFNVFASGNIRPKVQSSFSSDRVSMDTVVKQEVDFQQHSAQYLKRHGLQTGAGFDWTYKKRNNFTGAIRMSDFGSLSSGNVDQVQIISSTSSPAVISSSHTSNNTIGVSSFTGVNTDLSYKRTFTKEDQELSFDFNGDFGKSRGKAFNTQYFLPNDSLYYGVNSNNPAHENEISLNIDYAQPFSDNVKLGIGSKLDVDNIQIRVTTSMFPPRTKFLLLGVLSF